MKKVLIGIGGVVGAALLIVAGIAIGKLLPFGTANPLPESIQSTIDFSVFVVKPDSEDYSMTSIKADTAEDSTKILSYIIEAPFGNVTVSEYPQPAQFSEIPDFKDKFLNDVMQQTSTVTTTNGPVVIGRMAKQEVNKQIAVLLEKGLVVFFTPEKTLSDEEWRKLADNLVIVSSN